jgi:hypothetical protein
MNKGVFKKNNICCPRGQKRNKLHFKLEFRGSNSHFDTFNSLIINGLKIWVNRLFHRTLIISVLQVSKIFITH